MKLSKPHIIEGKIYEAGTTIKIKEYTLYHDNPKEVRYDSNQITYGEKRGYKLAGAIGDKYKDMVLFNPSSYDLNDVKNVPLKAGEKIYRYVTDNTITGGMIPYIKVNMERGLAYHLTQESSNGTIDDVVFESRSIKLIYGRILV